MFIDDIDVDVFVLCFWLFPRQILMCASAAGSCWLTVCQVMCLKDAWTLCFEVERLGVQLCHSIPATRVEAMMELGTNQWRLFVCRSSWILTAAHEKDNIFPG